VLSRIDAGRIEPIVQRLFVEEIPTAATSAQVAIMQSADGGNDGATHQLARFVTDTAPFGLTGMNVRVIWRRDRYLRGSDYISTPSPTWPGTSNGWHPAFSRPVPPAWPTAG
jgi:hypothetical protein